MGAEQESKGESTGNPSSPGAIPFRGRVLDIATGDPIGHALVRAGDLQAPVDAGGRFECERALPPGVKSIEFHDPFLGRPLGTVAREELELDPREEGSWIARIPIGPTYRLVAPEGAAPDLAGWRGRLIESDLKKENHIGEFQPIHPGPPPFLRSADPWTPNEPGNRFLIEVAGPCKRGWSGLLDSAVGVYREPVPLSIYDSERTLRGRVVDPEGDGVGDASVMVVPLEHPQTGNWVETTTDPDGSFELRGFEPGPHRLFARSRPGETPRTRRVDVDSCETVVEDIVVPARPGAGNILGRLVNASGAALDESQHLLLRGLDGSFEQVVASSPGCEPSLLPNGKIVNARGRPGEQIFQFDGVPAGLFELSVISNDVVPWNPPAARISPPCDDAVFKRRDDLPLREVRFTALDSETGAELGWFSVHWADRDIRAGQVWLQAGERIPLPPAGRSLEWIVSAQGYRPVRVAERDLRETAEGLEATVRLRRGWGSRFVLRNNDIGLDTNDYFEDWVHAIVRPPVAGAAILADRQVIGHSDRNGEVLLELDHPPAHVEIRAPGWRVIRQSWPQEGWHDYEDYLVWLIAE